VYLLDPLIEIGAREIATKQALGANRVDHKDDSVEE
jgi:hypothetical protein